jgi:soluble lytic murein transglycosylase-like protein
VMPHWKKVLGIQGDLRDVDTSVQYGMQVLGFYQEMYRDIDLALTAYNRGPGPVDNALVKGRDPQNGYAPKVLEVYKRLKTMSASPEKK